MRFCSFAAGRYPWWGRGNSWKFPKMGDPKKDPNVTRSLLQGFLKRAPNLWDPLHIFELARHGPKDRAWASGFGVSQRVQVPNIQCLRLLAPNSITGLLYNHPEVNRLWGIYGIYHDSFKDHILSTPGWL